MSSCKQIRIVHQYRDYSDTEPRSIVSQPKGETPALLSAVTSACYLDLEMTKPTL